MFIYVRVDVSEITEFTQLLTENHYNSFTMGDDSNKYKNVFVISMRQKNFTRLLSAPDSKNVLSKDDFIDLFL